MKVRQMARDAVCGRSGEAVVHVALAALHSAVRARQGKFGLRVIEPGALPLCGGVAESAVLGKSGGPVVGVCGGVKVRHVARGTVGCRPREAVVHMALRTLGRAVTACQREPGQAVVETGALPGDRGVAAGALLRESRPSVTGIGRPAMFSGVASKTSGRRALELSSDMAGTAVRLDMRSLQGKAG